MEPDKIHMRIEDVVPHEDEMERASNSYVMSLVAIVIGLPMPIINLIATGLFFFMSRKATFYVRWNCIQALISQIPLFIMNNILFWWTVRILLCFTPLSSLYISYFIVVNIYNIYDFYATIKSAVQTRKGRIFKWHLYGTLTDMFCRG